jgi:hypothetical protein
LSFALFALFEQFPSRNARIFNRGPDRRRTIDERFVPNVGTYKSKQTKLKNTTMQPNATASRNALHELALSVRLTGWLATALV